MKNGKTGTEGGRRATNCDPDIEKMVKNWILRDLACISLVSIQEQSLKKVRRHSNRSHCPH